MVKEDKRLNRQFQPQGYSLSIKDDAAHLIISGRKMPPPNKRITFHQKGLKIISAKIIRKDKKGPQEYEIKRINHLPTFEEVRLHTKELLYPGDYEIVLEYQLKKPPAPKPSREFLPSIDEPEAWAEATFELK